MTEPTMVEIEEPKVKVVEKPTKAELEEQGVSQQEIEMHEKHGLLKEEAPDEEPKEEPKDDKDLLDGKTEDELAAELKDGRELTEEEERKFNESPKYSNNVKDLYRKQKKYHKLAQDREREIEKLRQESGLSIAQKRVAEAKIRKIEELFRDPENLTQEAIKDILALKEVEPTEDEKKSDEERQKAEVERQKQLIADNLKEQERIGREKYENFDDLLRLADEVMAGKFPNVRYQRKMQRFIASTADFDPEPGESMAEIMAEIARLHPEYGKTNGNGKPKNPEIEKVIKNAEKRPPSAGVGGGRRMVSEDDLTPDDVSGMSQSKWNSLSDKTRERLMRG